MAEKKVNTMRKTATNTGKQEDQVLSGGFAYGKIQPPTPAQKPAAPAVPEAQSTPVLPTAENGLQKPAANRRRQPVQNRNNDGGTNNNAAQNKPKQQPRQQQAPKKTGDLGQAPKALQNQPKPAAQQPKTPVGQAEKTNQPAQANRQGQPRQQRGRQPKNRQVDSAPSIKAYFLGGLNEIGKNLTVFECGNDMIIVDCGLAFPDDDMLGIDIVIPDFTFIEKNISRIRGIVITHGHEDHIGGLPFFFKRFKLPIYGTALAMGLLQVKLKEHNLHNSVKMNPLPAGSHIKLGCFDVEMIHVNHSISDAVALAIHSPAGTVVHTGDFKIDFTPTEGGMIDLARFAELGKQGVLALMADSTNVERPGYTQTEQKVHETLDILFARAERKRIIVATFASNISRVQQIINCAAKYKRKVALSGRSMVNVMTIATELGYLNVPAGILIDLAMINRYKPEQVVLITTGSQGETMAALSRMAFAEHRQVEVGENDFIIISARPIPGNEKTVGNVVDELLKRGCDVVYESMYEVHVSGHACQEELKLIQCLTKPKFFIPVHGEQKHLRKHASLAMQLGVPRENIFIGDVGKGIELNRNFMKPTADVPAGEVLVDGIGVGDVGSIVLRDRKHLAEDGLIIAVCSIDSESGHVVAGPDIVSRGFVYVRESEELMEIAKKLVNSAIEACADQGVHEWGAIKIRIRDVLSKFLYEKTRRNPMILPIIMEI